MMFELMLAGFIMAVGLAIAGTGTYFYQWLIGQQAMLRYDGKTFVHMIGHLFMSFVCGPFIMLQMGWRQEDDGTLSVGSVLVQLAVSSLLLRREFSRRLTFPVHPVTAELPTTA